MKRILVIRAGQLGDLICASSIIEPLRHHFGKDTEIDWIAKRGIGSIFANDTRINHVFEVKSRKLPLLANPAKIAPIIHSFGTPYDYVINLELGSIFNTLMRLIRAKHKIGMPYQYFAEPPEAHAVDNLILIYRSFLNEDDLTHAIPTLRGNSAKAVIKRFQLPEKYIILVPANSHTGKFSINHRAWPEMHWKSLISALAAENVRSVIIGGHADKEMIRRLGPFPENTLNLAGKTSFTDLISIIQKANVVVTTDTGPSHLAAAVNTPVIALVGPTNFKRTGPYETKQNTIRVVSAMLPCSPCYHTERQKTCKDNLCMQEITTSTVLNEIRAYI